MMHLQRKYTDCLENCSVEALHLFQVVCHGVTEQQNGTVKANFVIQYLKNNQVYKAQ